MTRLVEIAAPDGNTMVFRVEELTDADRAVVGPAFEAYIAQVVAETGCTEREACGRLLIGLAHSIRDDEAYERVCARKGLLPL